MELHRKPCSDSPDHPVPCRFPSPHPFPQGEETDADSQAIKVLLVEHDSNYAAHIERVIGEQENSLIQLERTEWLDVASHRIRKGRVDAVLLDISLPETSGVEIFRAIHHAGPRVPVLILTDLDDETMACQLLREGAQDYLLKHTLNAQRISRSVRFAVERTKARKRPRSSRRMIATACPNRNWA
jgi:DNA-binding response OmpR family regulator